MTSSARIIVRWASSRLRTIKASQYQNSDHAGTPANFKSNAMNGVTVIGGATGGGGSNYTGGYSGTVTVGPF